MSYLINNQQKVNDIIFDRRNKAYGAYAIRSDYGNTVVKSLSIMFLGFGTLMSVAFYLSNRNIKPMQNGNEGLIHDSTTVVIFDLKKDDAGADKKAEEKIEKKREEPKLKDKDNVVVIDSVKTENSIAINGDVKGKETSTVTGEGDTSLPNNIESNGGEKKTGDGGEGAVHPPYGVDSGPEYEGGLPALYKFVGSHLKYPSIAAEIGKEGTVYVKFVVDEKGKVGNLTLLNNTGYGLDEEAIRVISMIPNFKTPAKVNGRPVKVYYQLPVRFRYK